MRRIIWFVIALLCLGDAAAEAGRRGKRSNMPNGWQWPPSESMVAKGAECVARLDGRGIEVKEARRGHRVTTPILVPAMSFEGLRLTPIFRKPPFLMDCHLADALAVIGPSLRSLGVAELRFSTITETRKVRVNGRTKNTLSRHALGLAIDVFEVVTDDGVTHVVETDYGVEDPVLLAIEWVINESGAFRTVITPRVDPVSHSDHFHLEAVMQTGAVTPPRRASKAKRSRRAVKRARLRRQKKARRAKQKAAKRAKARRQKNRRAKRKAARRAKARAERRAAKRKARRDKRRAAN